MSRHFHAPNYIPDYFMGGIYLEHEILHFLHGFENNCYKTIA